MQMCIKSAIKFNNISQPFKSRYNKTPEISLFNLIYLNASSADKLFNNSPNLLTHRTYLAHMSYIAAPSANGWVLKRAIEGSNRVSRNPVITRIRQVQLPLPWLRSDRRRPNILRTILVQPPSVVSVSSSLGYKHTNIQTIVNCWVILHAIIVKYGSK